MEFGRLKDTRFPNLDTVDVYAYRNEFDYTRWVAGTTIKLCNVLWNSDYSDVVHFTSDILRDKWFNELTDYYTVTLDSDRAYVPEQEVKVPVPYDVAARYNYMVITIPILPGSSPAINYEDEEAGIRKWYFFIDSIDYRAPNTTGCRISLDVWTQYQNDIYIRYMMLERGHAPVAFSDVDDFLENPIENNDYILAPDITPSSADIVRDSTYIPFGNGEKYVCFASTCATSAEFEGMGIVEKDDPEYTYGNITYSDTADRYGYQLQVNGFKVGSGENYSPIAVSSGVSGCSQDLIPNGTYMWAVKAGEAEGFLEAIKQYKPTFLRTIQACFMVDASMIDIDLEKSVFFRNICMYSVVQKNTQLDIQLTKEMFGIPQEYQHLAKLYTFPYSVIEITDNQGETIKVRVENTGSITAHKDAMLAFPYLNARIWFEGINGIGSETYTWVNMYNQNLTRDMPNSDWSFACFDLDIPCYALYMDAETAWKMDNFWSSIRGNGKRALADYHSAVRNVNTARANAIDSNNTVYSNTDRDATTLVTNTNNTAICNRANADLTIAANTAVTAENNSVASDIMQHADALAGNDLAVDVAVSISTSVAENDRTTSVAQNSSLTDAKAGFLAGSMAGVGIGTAFAPGVGSAVGAGIGAAIGALGAFATGMLTYDTAKANSTIIANANTAVTNAAIASSNQHCASSRAQAAYATFMENNGRTANNTTNNNAFSSQTNNTNATMRENANNNAITMRADANDTRNTGNANAGYTREVGVLNAQEKLESFRDVTQYGMYDSRLGAPIQLTQDRGDAYPDLGMYKGVQFKIKTMPDGDMRQIGDTFMRYGYALNQMWDINTSGLCPMPHFCYWKAEDIWVDDRLSSNNSVQEIIVNIFKRGVTIWNNPDEVGRVSIYANK